MRRNKFSIRKRRLEKTEKNNVTITLNVFYPKKEKRYPSYVLKHDSSLKKTSYSFNDSKRKKM